MTEFLICLSYLAKSTYLYAAGAAIYIGISSSGNKVFKRILLVLLNKLYLESYTSSLIELGSEMNNSAGRSFRLSSNLTLLWRTWGIWNELKIKFIQVTEKIQVSTLYFADNEKQKFMKKWKRSKFHYGLIIAMVSCSRIIWITNSSDHRRVWTANLLHTR